MSYQKYIQYKDKIKVEVNTEKYEEHLRSLIEEKIFKGSKLKDILCKEEIYEMIKESYYPQAEALRIAIVSNENNKIKKQFDRLKEWAGSNHKELVRTIGLIESGDHFDILSKDKEQSIKMHTDYYKKIMFLLANKIESVVKNIKWKNYSLKIEAVPVEGAFFVEDLLLSINDQKTAFIELRTLQDKKIEGSIYYKEFLKLIENIKNIKNPQKISSFYVESSFANKKMIENAKKEISLGLKSYLPFGIKLSKERNENSAWRIKINENDLLNIENQYFRGTKETQIKLIEKL